MRWPACLLLMLAVACDIPTELPKWNPTFAVPLQSISIPLAQVLPAGVDVSSDGAAFVISTGSFTMRHRLRDWCSLCGQVDGLTVPKPGFQGSISQMLPLPAGVDSASIVSGVIGFRMTNGWNFDPLRTGGPEIGAINVQVLGRDGRVGGATTFIGELHAFPPGITLTGTVAFGELPAQTPIVHISISSPAGNPVRIDTQLEMEVAITSGQVVATDVTMNPGQRQLTSGSVSLNLTGIDDFIIDRAQRGKLLLDVTNQFAVSGTMTLNVAGGINPVMKTFELRANDTMVEVPLSEAEIESILGRAVVASITGFVSTGGAVIGPRATFTVQPLLVLELGEGS